MTYIFRTNPEFTILNDDLLDQRIPGRKKSDGEVEQLIIAFGNHLERKRSSGTL